VGRVRETEKEAEPEVACPRSWARTVVAEKKAHTEPHLSLKNGRPSSGDQGRGRSVLGATLVCMHSCET
jgi:hypothetical protein